MSRFAPKDEVAVWLPEDENLPFEQRDVVWIKPRMDFGTERRVMSQLQKIKMDRGDGELHGELDIASQNFVLLQYNILRWQGPGFDGRKFNAETLAELNKDDPLMDAVLEEINRRNLPKAKDEANPNSPTAGETSSPESSKKKQ